MSLTAPQETLLRELMLLDDLYERLSAVVDRARHRAPLPADRRSPAHRVSGCVSQVWLVAEFRDGRCHFHADADSPLVRGLVLLLTDFFNDSTPAEILATDADPLDSLDLTRLLSSTRRHGLAAVRATIRAFAEKHSPAKDATLADE